jgi:large subunit ribosomal protein L6
VQEKRISAGKSSLGYGKRGGINMSRVGKEIIKLPSGTSVEFLDGVVSVSSGGKVLRQKITGGIVVKVEADKVTLERPDDTRGSKALHGLYNRLIRNMVEGVSKGFTKHLILNGVGYRAALKGADLNMSLGLSHPVNVAAPNGITFKVLNPAEVAALNLGKEGVGAVIAVIGNDKEAVGAAASKIRDLRPVEPYHLYGIRYSDEKVRRKESKSGAKGGGK